jgi:hypothetical protein
VRILRVVLLPAYAAAGALTGIASVALHQRWWGLLLGLVAPAVTLVALHPGWARLPFALGWVAMIGYLSMPHPAGGFVIADGLAGYVLLAAAMAFLVSALVTLPHPRKPAT